MMVALLAFFSCVEDVDDGKLSEESDEPVEMVFAASFGATKATLVDDVEVWWMPGDRILVNGDTFNSDITQQAREADFTGMSSPAARYDALYAKSMSETSWKDGSYKVKLVPTQYAAKGQFPAYLSAASCHDDDKSLKFDHLLGYVKVTIPEGSMPVSELWVSARGGEIMSGNEVAVDFSGRQPQLVKPALSYKDEKWTFARLISASYLDPGDYYIAVYPGTYSEGLDFKFVREDGREIVRTIDQKLTLLPGEISDFSFDLYDQFDALMQLYKATGGDDWVINDGWGTDKPLNEWYGLRMLPDADGKERLFEISLIGNNLNGEITADILEGLPTLEALIVNDNAITSLETGSHQNLKQLWCNDNPMSDIDVKGLPNLRELICGGCRLAELSVAGCSELVQLGCRGNILTGIEFGGNDKLIDLDCSDNMIESLDFTECPNLQTLGCTNTRKGYALRSLDLSMLHDLRYLLMSNDLSSLDVSHNTDLEVLVCNIDGMPSVDLSNNRKLKQITFSDTDNDSGVFELDLSNNGELEQVCVYNRRLSHIDVTALSFLTDLVLYDCSLTELNVSGNPLLDRLVCSNNKLTSLDVSNNVALRGLQCEINLIEELDLSYNVNLSWLYCSRNNLSDLDVRPCPSLSELKCDGNQNLAKVHAYSYQNFKCTRGRNTELVYYGDPVDDPDRPYHYESVDYSQDGEVFILQEASEGNGIDIVLMGDGFTDRLIADGTYAKVMNYAMEAFFTEEPYKSYREYFNVYYVNAVSVNEVYDEYSSTVFNCKFKGEGSSVISGNSSKVKDYALKAVDPQCMDDAVVIVILNSTTYAGTCYMFEKSDADYGRGLTISYCPLCESDVVFTQVVTHEAGGHGFAKLGDEYADLLNFVSTIPDSEKKIISRRHNIGWYANVDITEDPAAVRWCRFLTDSRYEYEELGVYEEAFSYRYGAYRPSWQSIMRHNFGGFNAPSREAIYYRIHKLAYGEDWEYDYEKFVKYDAVNRPAATRSVAVNHNYVEKDFLHTASPVIIYEDWRTYQD